MTAACVSVVIPTYNSAALVTDAVESVLAQTSLPGEVIVVDDGSTDQTRERLAPYGDRIRYVYQDNGGVAAARNRGIAEARGELIAFLDADDAWHPRKLELQLEVLRQRPDIALLGTTGFTWPTSRLPDIDERVPGELQVISWHQLLVKNYFGTSSVIARRSALERAGQFDTNLHGPEDYDLWLRIAETSTVANLHLPLVGWRPVPGSLSRRPARMEADMQTILRKLDQRGAWKGDRLLRRKAYSFCAYTCALMYRAEHFRWIALSRLLRSFFWYPFPYRRGEVATPLARLKMLARTFIAPPPNG